MGTERKRVEEVLPPVYGTCVLTQMKQFTERAKPKIKKEYQQKLFQLVILVVHLIRLKIMLKTTILIMD